MSSTWIIVALILGFLIVFQIAKASEYVAILRGEEKTRKESNRINAFLLLVFLVFKSKPEKEDLCNNKNHKGDGKGDPYHCIDSLTMIRCRSTEDLIL
jgi:hypothetical protein